MPTATSIVVLEAAAQEFAEATANPPYLFDLGPEKGRQAVDEVQSSPADTPAADLQDIAVPAPGGNVPIRIVRPQAASRALPVILYIHGAGWVFGNRHTHDRLVRELATSVGAAVVFPDYSLSPEARYPTAVEESYAVLRWVADHGAAFDLDPTRDRHRG